MPSIQLRRSPKQKQAQRIADQCGLTEAYSDPCFQSSTRFFIASPEHPKMGKWAQPSTLKSHYYAPWCPYEGASSLAPTRSNARPKSCCYLVDERGRIISGLEASRRSGRRALASRQSKARRRAASASSKPVAARIEQRAASPEPQRDESAECRPETPNFSGSCIYTPVSGRVVSLHKRSFHDVAIPSLPSGLCGSFNQHRLPSPLVSAVVGAGRSSVAASSANRTSPLADILGTNASPSPSPTGKGIDQMPESPRRAGGVKKEDGTLTRPSENMLLAPDIRYRVRLEGISLIRNNGGVSGVSAYSKKQAVGKKQGSNTFFLDDGGHPAGKEELESKDASPTRGTEATAQPGATILGSYLMGKEKKGAGGDDDLAGDPWVLSEVDPFILALRSALLRDRPADVASFATAFSNNW